MDEGLKDVEEHLKRLEKVDRKFNRFVDFYLTLFTGILLGLFGSAVDRFLYGEPLSDSYKNYMTILGLVASISVLILIIRSVLFFKELKRTKTAAKTAAKL